MVIAKKIALAITVLAVSFLAASQSIPPATLKDLFLLIADLFNKIIPVIVAIALLVFFYGISKLILYADNEQKRREGINTIIWGLIALFVIVSIWGIVFVFTGTFFGTSDVPSFFDLPRDSIIGPLD